MKRTRGKSSYESSEEGGMEVSNRPVNSSSSSWPAPSSALEAARSFLQEWYVLNQLYHNTYGDTNIFILHHDNDDSASSSSKTLLLPDKDADGLCGTLIVYRTLISLGLSPSFIYVHFVSKGSNVHEESEGVKIEEYGARYIIVVDQGSRGGGVVKTLIVDHHWSEDFPEGALVSNSLECANYGTTWLSLSYCRSYPPRTVHRSPLPARSHTFSVDLSTLLSSHNAITYVLSVRWEILGVA